MSVTAGDARRMAELARLRLDDAELGRLAAELNRSLDHVVALAALEDGEGTDPAPPADGLRSVRSSGAETPDPLVRGPGSVAPERREGFFVSRVMGRSGRRADPKRVRALVRERRG